MQRTSVSNSADRLPGPVPRGARPRIFFIVFALSVVLGTLWGAVWGVVVYDLRVALDPDLMRRSAQSSLDFEGISLFLGVVWGLISGLLAGTLDGLALSAAARSAYLGKMPALASAALTALISVVPVTILLSESAGHRADFLDFLIDIVMFPAGLWLILIWAGYFALRRTLRRFPMATSELPQPSRAAEPAQAPLAPLAPQLPFTPSSTAVSRRPHVPSRHRPSRRLPHPVAGHARS